MIKKYGMYILITALVLIASVLIYVKINPKTLPKNLISATGKIDGDLIALNTKYPGRITSIHIQEGEPVKKGEVIAVLSSKEQEKKLSALQAEVHAAQEGVKAMREELAITKCSLTLNITKAKEALEISKSQKEQLLNAIAAQKALLLQTQKDYERLQTLFEKKLIAKHKLELAQLKVTAESEKYKALEHKKKAATQAVNIAEANYKLAQTQKRQIAALRDKISAQKNKTEALKANKGALETAIDELTVTSPIDGFVVEKIANVGEVLGAGMVVATLIDPKNLYLKVYVDTLTNGKIKIGDKAVIFLDAAPNRAIEAKVSAISANAEFTPKEVAVKSDRIQRVYGVRLRPLQVDPLLKLGIPAVGIITTDGKSLPKSLNDIPSI